MKGNLTPAGPKTIGNSLKKMGVMPVNKTLLDFFPNSSHQNESASRDFIDFCAKEIFNKEMIVYKKTDEWYSE